jgi:hypothetical protein
MNAVGDVLDRADRPAYVRFERTAKEDVAASLAAGHYVARDVDVAHITPPYSKDVFKIKVSQWFENLKQDVANGRIPELWVENYKKAYQAWQNGQELPLSGTPIRGWGVISPAQQETLIRMNVLTVEDLGAMNDEGIKRFGMGALDLKNKATAWLRQLNDKGPLTQEMAALQNENRQLKTSVETLTNQVQAMMTQLKIQGAKEESYGEDTEISASDLLDDEPTPTVVKRKPGRPPKGA